MSNKKVILVLTGDVMLGGEFLHFREERGLGWEYPFTKVRPFFKEADIVFGNLECTLSKSGETRKDREMALYSPPESIKALKYLGYNILSLANNHINDYGEAGLTETIEVLRENDIPCFGAGRNLGEAGEGAFIERGGVRFGFLGYTTCERHVNSIIADAKRAGCVAYDLPRIEKDIARIMSRADIICISLHWGYGNQIYPSPEQVKLARQIVEAGANVIIGHHPHVVQGWERYKHGVIFYSLGNFFFPNYYNKSGSLSKWSKENNDFIIARCEIEKGGVGKVEVLPSYRGEGQKVIILEGEDRERATAAINELSLVITKNDYESLYSAYNKTWKQEKLLDLLGRLRKHGFKGITGNISVANIKLYLGMSLECLKDVLIRRQRG